ncbi:MAG: hypothetical protein LC650_03965 [Actinobacteria bacterium]|nr:hypothetical protein [Actinomycetota bacterium]
MANINDVNRFILRSALRDGNEVAFSYTAKSDGHERVVVGTVETVTDYHVTLTDRVRGNAVRVFILDRVRGSILRLR